MDAWNELGGLDLEPRVFVAPAAASAMDTDLDEVVRKRKDTLDGLLSKFEFEGETVEVKLSAEEAAAVCVACKKTKLGRLHLAIRNGEHHKWQQT